MKQSKEDRRFYREICTEFKPVLKPRYPEWFVRLQKVQRQRQTVKIITWLTIRAVWLSWIVIAFLTQ
jgi:hypothetical protein